MRCWTRLPGLQPLFPVYPKGFLSGWDKDPVLAPQRSSTPNSLIGVFMDWALCWCAVMLEQEGAIPKLFPQHREHEIVQNTLVCSSIKSSFPWIQEVKPNFWKTTPDLKIFTCHKAVRNLPSQYLIFTWPTNLRLSCCGSQSLCYNTTKSGLWNI